MEKQTSAKNSPPGPALPQQLSPQDWETLIDDFQSGIPSRRERWLPFPLLDRTFNSLLRKDFPLSLKLQLLLFLEDSSDLLFRSSSSSSLPPLLDFLRSLLTHYPVELSLKEQAMISTTSIAITALDIPSPHLLDPLAELLLSVANRPNHGPDRHMRFVACECLRELELAYPLLLSDAAGHLWSLAQAERTHAAQSYILLLATAIASIARYGLLSSSSSILSTAVTLVPFNSPGTFTSPCPSSSQPSDLNLRELRRIVAFLLERPQVLTPCATMELVSVLASIVGALERHMQAVAALLKVQFSGLLYCYDPILCHVVLMLYSRFSDTFSGEDELGISRRLALIPKEAHQALVFRLLAIHWLLGSPRLAREKGFLASLAHCFYPSVFDPLALKAAKLDVLAGVAAHADRLEGERATTVQEGKKEGSATVVKLLDDGLVCVSAFKWLPPCSTETSVAFRTLHKFLIGVSSHHGSGLADDELHAVFASSIFQTLQSMLVELALSYHVLVPVVAAFVDRLMGCKGHVLVGERLLQTLDAQLLPKLDKGFLTASYFPIFERIARNDTIPPGGLLKLLTKHMLYLTDKHGSETGLRSWSQGSKVLGICRTMLVRHRNSRVFLGLSHLLAFTSQFFPDLEVRDSARICLRMILCIPGRNLKTIIDFGGQLPGVSPSPQPASFFQDALPQHVQNTKKLSSISSYIHIERAIPPLVEQSWSLAFPNLETRSETSYSEEIKDISNPSTTPDSDADVTIDRISLQVETLRVVDSKDSETLRILRRHFSCIPDYRHMPGTKIGIPCLLRFKAQFFNRVWGFDSPIMGSDLVDNLPALYAIVVTFKSTAKYGSIPACRVPFLLGEPSKTGLDVVPIKCDVQENSSFQAAVTVELEPREPMPGLIDTELTANIENGQILSGMLQSITVGFEDMFLKASIPSDVVDDRMPHYYLDLFHALWETCGSSTNIGRETFLLNGGKGAAAIYGTESVKLLDVSPDSLITATEQYLAPFVVSVAGQPLVNIVASNGIIKNVIWEEDSAVFPEKESKALVPYSENEPLQLEYTQDEISLWHPRETIKRNIGTFLVLIFLPPRFHLLFQMEVGNISTLVRIRTDHWPCLAYVDEYLESLVTDDF